MPQLKSSRCNRPSFRHVPDEMREVSDGRPKPDGMMTFGRCERGMFGAADKIGFKQEMIPIVGEIVTALKTELHYRRVTLVNKSEIADLNIGDC